MIRVKNNIPADGKDPLARCLRKAISKTNIAFVNQGYDFVFEMANGLKNPEPNTIAFERIDGCQIRNRSLLVDPNVVKLVKMYHCPELEANNAPCVDGRLFTRMLTDKQWTPPKPEVAKKDFSKIVCGLNFLHYDVLDTLADHAAERSSSPDRPVDLFFAGTTTYKAGGGLSGALISQHRRSAVEACRGLASGDNEVWDTMAFSRQEYHRRILKAKVLVSPWGWGEACYRDYEAILCGCALVKPMAYPIRSMDGIYADGQTYWCLPDWSDLAEVVSQALIEYEGMTNQRYSRRLKLLRSRSWSAQVSLLERLVRH